MGDETTTIFTEMDDRDRKILMTPYGRNIQVRMAKNSDGDAVAALMDQSGSFQFDDWTIDWSDLDPTWLVAECDGKILGCVQSLPAKPIGRIEILCVDMSIEIDERRQIWLDLYRHAIAMHVMFGSQAVLCMISYLNTPMVHGAEKHGWIKTDEGFMFIKRIR
jgi:hypothetical protein